MTTFLDPKVDMVFKKLFATNTHTDVLMSFLNSVLGREEGEKIAQVDLNDPYNNSETDSLKWSIVDVRCTDQRGRQYIIEMQFSRDDDYAARSQYYASLALSRQLASSEQYAKLVPVIFISILNFNLFKTKDCLSKHLILDAKTYAHELAHLEFYFIELNKFNKEISDLATIFDKWVYFFKYAQTFHHVPSEFKESAVEKAFEIVAQARWKLIDLELYDRQVDAVRCQKSQLASAIREGMEKKQLEIARNFLDILDVETVAKKTGLTVEQVEALKKHNS